MRAARVADAGSPRLASWTEETALAHLRSLELFGMRFGLQRMRALTEALGSPQRSFESIHVVGTNGKSSTARMIAAILARHGLQSGAYLSPHLVYFGERIRIGHNTAAGLDVYAIAFDQKRAQRDRSIRVAGKAEVAYSTRIDTPPDGF